MSTPFAELFLLAVLADLPHICEMRVSDNRTQGPTAQWLLAQIERFLTINRMENDGNLFGWYVSQDRSLVTRLRDGGDVTTTRMDDILAFLQYPVTKTRDGVLKELDLRPIKIRPKELPHGKKA